MAHVSLYGLRFFSRDGEFCGAFDDGPPLVGNVMVSALEDPGRQLEFPEQFGDALRKLRKWASSLYMKFQWSNDGSVGVGQAKEWLSAVESNLCLVLESIGKGDRKQGLYALARTFWHWDSIAVNIERVLVMLYKGVDLRRREGEPGHLIKLRQVIGKVLGGALV